MEYFDTLYKKDLESIEIGAPAILQETAIIKDTVDEKILLRNTFVNISEKTVVAIAIKGKLTDIFGEPVKYNEEDYFKYVYQDIIFEANTLFGNKIPIELPSNARKAIIEIDKVVLQDGTIWETNQNNIVKIQQQREIEASDEFMENLDDNTIKPIFYFVENQECWQCTCGQANKITDECCRKCRRPKELVKSKFNKEAIKQQYDEFQQAKEEKVRQEELKKRQLEKLHETEIEKETEHCQGKKIKSKSSSRRNKATITGICVIAAVALIVCVAIFSQKPIEKKVTEETAQSETETEKITRAETEKATQAESETEGATEPGISESDLIQQTRESIRPYVETIGISTENNYLEVTESFENNKNRVKIMGKKGSTSLGCTQASGNEIAMMDWQSNESMSTEEYNEFTKSLDKYFGEEADAQQYDNIPSKDCLVWNDLDNRCWVVGWYYNEIAYLRWYGKDYWNY